MLALSLCVTAASAQQKDPRLNPPFAPLQPLSADESSSKAPGANSTGAAPDAAQTRRDSRPLSGAEQGTLGSGSGARNFLLSSFHFYAGGDTNPQSIGNNSAPTAQTTVGGELALHRQWKRYELTTQYTGDEEIYSSHPELNRSFHELAFSQKAAWSRWKMSLDDQASYSPDARATYFNFGNLPSGLGSAINTGLLNLNPFLTPNQSILTVREPRISNTVAGELDYTASARSTLTLSGSYGLLHFLDSGFIDERNFGVRTGYDYRLTPRDTVSVSYAAMLFRFDSGTSLDSHTVYLSYGRRITGRLLFEVSGGPQVTLLHGLAAGADTLTSWSLNTSIRYRLSNSDLSLSYQRGVTGGSGVLLGAQTNQVRASLTRRLSRVWSGTVDFGYARNETLAPLAATSGNVTYDSWGGGFRLTRPVGHYAEMYFAYSAQRQTVQSPGCVGAACGFVGLRQVFGIGFNFRFRPVQID